MNELKETHPTVEIKKYNLITNKEKRKEHNIKTIPTLIIGEDILGGLIKKEEYQAALNKFLKKINES
jgi:hypothetical protein